MGDQHGRTILERQFAPGRSIGIGERGQRILHGGDVQAGGLKQRDHFGPAGAVRPCPVHQHDVARLDGRGLLSARGLDERRGQRGDGYCDDDPSYLHLRLPGLIIQLKRRALTVPSPVQSQRHGITAQ